MIKDNGDMFHYQLYCLGASAQRVGNWLDCGDCEYMGEVNHFSTVRLERRRMRQLRDEAEREGGGTERVES